MVSAGCAPIAQRPSSRLLERRWPDEWGKREKVDLEVYVRQRSRELGLDEDLALQTVRSHCG